MQSFKCTKSKLRELNTIIVILMKSNDYNALLNINILTLRHILLHRNTLRFHNTTQHSCFIKSGFCGNIRMWIHFKFKQEELLLLNAMLTKQQMFMFHHWQYRTHSFIIRRLIQILKHILLVSLIKIFFSWADTKQTLKCNLKICILV